MARKRLGRASGSDKPVARRRERLGPRVARTSKWLGSDSDERVARTSKWLGRASDSDAPVARTREWSRTAQHPETFRSAPPESPARPAKPRDARAAPAEDGLQQARALIQVGQSESLLAPSGPVSLSHWTHPSHRTLVRTLVLVTGKTRPRIQPSCQCVPVSLHCPARRRQCASESSTVTAATVGARPAHPTGECGRERGKEEGGGKRMRARVGVEREREENQAGY